MTSETKAKTDIRKHFGMVPYIRLFNFIVGDFWAGKPVLETGLRRVKAGVPGVSDLIGWRSITITADMVGNKIAQFVAIETKKPGGGVEAQHQENFINLVKEQGGLAGFARTTADAERILGI